MLSFRNYSPLPEQPHPHYFLTPGSMPQACNCYWPSLKQRWTKSLFLPHISSYSSGDGGYRPFLFALQLLCVAQPSLPLYRDVSVFLWGSGLPFSGEKL
jgi:hypothetical protein